MEEPELKSFLEFTYQHGDKEILCSAQSLPPFVVERRRTA
jgi:hypothetical protein